MPKITRGGPRSAVGQQFFEIEEVGALSFCPDSDDASTPATQVHLSIKAKDAIGNVFPPMVMRFFTPEFLDSVIEALIEHRTYVFGRRDWDSSKYREQPR